MMGVRNIKKLIFLLNNWVIFIVIILNSDMISLMLILSINRGSKVNGNRRVVYVK